MTDADARWDDPPAEPFRLDGKVALVTGAARGIGRACVQRLLQAGADVVADDLDGAALDDAVASLDLHGRRVVPVVADVADPGACRAMVRTAVDELGSLDVLVNNAGLYSPTPLGSVEGLDVDAIDRMHDVNVKAVIVLSTAAAEVMAPGSSIVHISSLGGVRPPFAGLAAYHATKGALDSLTRDMAVEWGGRGIRVNSAAPGGITTEGNDQVGTHYTPEQIAELTAFCEGRPLGRMGNADDIATVVVFLASPAARFVTGQQVLVDGGLFYR